MAAGFARGDGAGAGRHRLSSSTPGSGTTWASRSTRSCELRAQDLSELARDPRGSLSAEPSARLIERGESFAQLLTPGGRVLDATASLRGRSLLDGATPARRAARPAVRRPSADPRARRGRPAAGRAGPARRPARWSWWSERRAENRREALRSLRNELLIVGPIALAAGHRAGLPAGRRRAARGRRDARPRRRISADQPGERLPVPAAGDELQRLGTTLNEMLARLRGGARARARVRRRGGTRAAHAAGADARRARLRAALRADRGGAAGRDPHRQRRDRPARRAVRGAAAHRLQRPRPARAAPRARRRRRAAGQRAPALRLARPGARSPARRATRPAASRWTPTGCGSSRRSATSSTTRCATAPARCTWLAARDGDAGRAQRHRRGPGLRRRAPASRVPALQPRRRPSGPPTGPASASRSSRRSRTPTAAAPMPPTRRTAAPGSASACRT